jgi:hypothetical protein
MEKSEEWAMFPVCIAGLVDCIDCMIVLYRINVLPFLLHIAKSSGCCDPIDTINLQTYKLIDLHKRINLLTLISSHLISSHLISSQIKIMSTSAAASAAKAGAAAATGIYIYIYI